MLVTIIRRVVARHDHDAARHTFVWLVAAVVTWQLGTGAGAIVGYVETSISRNAFAGSRFRLVVASSARKATGNGAVAGRTPVLLQENTATIRVRLADGDIVVVH